MTRRKRNQHDDIQQISEPQAGDGSVQDAGQQPPEGVIVASNGAWLDAETGKFSPGGKPRTAIKTTSQAVALANLRWQRAAAAATTGLKRLSNKQSALHAWSKIVEHQGGLAMDPKAKRSSTEAARFVGQATGFLRDRQSGGEPPATGATMQISSEVGLAIAEMLASRQREGERGEDE